VYKPTLIINLCLLSFGVAAQTAEDYFHRGAQFYIDGQKQSAQREVVTGLTKYPKDPLLNGLSVLIRKEEEQQQQKQQQQQQQDQSKSEQQKQQQQQQQQQSSEQQNQDQQQQQAAQQKQEQEQKQSAAQAGKESKEKSEEKAQEAADYAAGKMTPEQARQLLDSQKSDELILTNRPEAKPIDRTKPFRDW